MPKSILSVFRGAAGLILKIRHQRAYKGFNGRQIGQELK